MVVSMEMEWRVGVEYIAELLNTLTTLMYNFDIYKP